MDSDGQTKVVRLGEATVRWTPTNEGATGYRLVEEAGSTLAEAEYAPDGTITLLDHDCQVVQRWTSDQLRSIVQGHGAILDESEAPPRRM